MSPIRRCLAAVFFLFGAPAAFAASPDCSQSGGTLLSWPTVDPVWEMCWLGPGESVGPRRSGLELRNIHYRGIKVAHRIHAPMLFAEYRLPITTCYRDWKDQPTPTLAHVSTHNQQAVPPDPSRTAATSCSVSQHPTQSYNICPHGQAQGGGWQCTTGQHVVIEDLGDHIRFVSQYRADWYMYDSRIRFYTNGEIEPTFGFGNNNGTYNDTTHWHHNYWRFEFGIDDQSQHIVAANEVDQSVEFHDLRGEPGSKTWSVRNPASGRGYELVPGAADYDVATNESGRNFHKVDFMATKYKPNEYGDNPNYSLVDCEMDEGNLVNNENILNQEVVLWYRVAVRDSTANNWPPGCGSAANPCLPQDSMICKTAGPRLVPFGNWGDEEPTPEEADLSIVAYSDPDPVLAGTQVQFHVQVDNAGPQDVSEVEVVFALPNELTLANALFGGSTWDCQQITQTVTCEMTGTLAAGSDIQFSVTFDVDADAADAMVDTAVSVSSSDWTDPDLENNAIVVETTIEARDLDTIFVHGFECSDTPGGCPVLN